MEWSGTRQHRAACWKTACARERHQELDVAPWSVAELSWCRRLPDALGRPQDPAAVRRTRPTSKCARTGRDRLAGPLPWGSRDRHPPVKSRAAADHEECRLFDSAGTEGHQHRRSWSLFSSAGERCASASERQHVQLYFRYFGHGQGNVRGSGNDESSGVRGPPSPLAAAAESAFMGGLHLGTASLFFRRRCPPRGRFPTGRGTFGQMLSKTKIRV